MMFSFMLILHRSITHILQEISIKLFKSRAIPIGVDKSNNFITRPVKLLDLGWGATQNIFKQLSLVLALPQNSVLPLWNEGESLFTHSMAGAFPTVENPFRVGSELLVNAYGSKVYAVPHPSEVILGSGELKSIVFMEVPTVGIIYKVRYRDDCISFGQLGLRGTTKGELIFDYFPTGAIFDYVTGQARDREFDRAAALEAAVRQGGDEFALVAAVTRDFFVCEEREKYYSVQMKPKASKKPKGGVIIRYLPRFRTKYLGIRERNNE